MKHRFFASKLNTALLLILVIFMVIAIRFMLSNKVELPIVENKQLESQEVKDTYIYSNHGFSIELPKGYVPNETESEGGPALVILIPNSAILYITNADFWEKANTSSFIYIKDEKIGNEIFKVYSYNNETFYWLRKGNIAYELHGNKKSFETFKFIGWSNKENISWVNSPVDFGTVVSYPSDWQVVPQHYASPAEQARGKDYLVGYTFTLPSGAVIIWGGAQGGCASSEFGEFKYGISGLTCLKGYRTSVGRSSAREVVSQSDLKLFGDFIVKNK